MPTAPQAEPDVRSVVTGEAAALLDPEGHFIHSNVAPISDFAAIDATRAGLLALAFVRTFAWPDQSVGTPLGEQLERQHGCSIDLNALEASHMVLGATPYADVSLDSPVWVRNLAGPRFVVRLRQRGRLAISAGMAAYAADVELVGDKVRLPPESGNEFSALGIPWNQAQLYPVSAERAAVTVANATGALIAKVPELLLAGRRFAFDMARWKVTLDREVAFRKESGSTSASNVVYVGIQLTSTGSLVRHDGLFLPAPEQPAEDTLSADPVVVLSRRADAPLTFDSVVPVR